MTTKRELILAALSAGLGIERNPVIGDFSGTFAALRDGAIELTEEFINGDIFEFTATPVLILAVEGGSTASRDAAIDALIESRLTQLDLLRASLGAAGLISDLRPQAPDYEANDVWGAVGVKAAEVPIEIDYWSDRSVG